LTGLSVGVGAGLALHDGSQVGRIALASLAQIPAAWVITSTALAVFGWVPRLTTAVWGLLVVFIALGEFGVLWNAPQWLMDLSPFQHSPLLPVGSAGVVSLIALTVTACVLAALGYAGWSRRDLTA
jgi:ABC-2 type transport system permease protein